jgi:LacI family transcriptional regulator
MNVSTSAEATIHLLEKHPLPDAIIGNNDMVAMVAMKIAKEKKLRIPQDIAIAGFADEPFSSFLEPSLTSVGQPAYLIGMKSMEIMLQMINDEIAVNEDTKIVLESALVIRDSTLR